MITGLLLTVAPLLWRLASSPWQTVLISLPTGFLWTGYNLASFNILLEMSPPEDREAGVAVYQTFVAVSAVIGPLLGGWLVPRIGYGALFAVSAAGRLAATLLFVTLARPGGASSFRRA